eukprot:scaffold5574_cov126-Isochrysis_galbana.AAC.1
MAQSLCSRISASEREEQVGTRKDAFDRPGMRTAASAYSRNSELQVAGARAANSSAVLNNGVISASWPSTGVEKGSRGSHPKSIVSGLAYWSLRKNKWSVVETIATSASGAGIPRRMPVTGPEYVRTGASAYSRNSELQVAGARAASSSAVLNNGVISASWPSTGVEKGSRGSRPKSMVSGLAYWMEPRDRLRLSHSLN